MIEVLSTLTGLTINEPRTVIERGFNGSSQETAGCFIKTFEVHSICNGIVLAVDREPKHSTWCITVEVNSQRWVRYCLLASAKVSVGQNIFKDDFLGYGYKGMMQLEYCTATESQFPVRILSKQLYKHDPSPIIFGQENLEDFVSIKTNRRG